MRWLDGSMDTNEILGWTLSWLHRLNGHEFEQTPGDSEGQRSLVRCSPRELDTTNQLNNNKLFGFGYPFPFSDFGSFQLLFL